MGAPTKERGGGAGSDPNLGAGLPIYRLMRAASDSFSYGAQSLKIVANAMKEKPEWQHIGVLLDAVASNWIVTRDAMAMALVDLDVRKRIVVTGSRANPEQALKNHLAADESLGLIDDQTTA